MYRILIAISLIVFNSCASAANSNSVKSSIESEITTDTNIIEIKPEDAPFDIWERIRLELSITIPKDQIAATSLYRERLYSNQTAVNRISKSGQRYLFHTLTRAQELGLPVELALLPFVESEFDPYAKSVDGATGIWQFLPATGKEYGLKSNWWYDGKKDVLASTEAAFRFLTYLNERFEGDWLLAMAAYNAGPTRVKRAIRKNKNAGKPTRFWDLNLPKETTAYVPKLLVLCELIRDPDSFDVHLPSIANRAYFQKVKIPGQLDLMQAADLAGLKPETIYELNPGFNQWATDPNGPFHILLPVGIADRFQVILDNTDPSELVQWDKYLVKKGDTLTSIAKKYLIDFALLKEINGFKDDTIYENEELIVPRGPSWIKDYLNKPDIYYVKAGDSMWSIAKKFNVTIRDLSIWNDLNPEKFLLTDTKILIYPKYFKEIKPKPVPKNDIAYPVKRGDSIIKISNKFGIPKEWILKWNDIPDETLIYPGQIIELKLSEIN